jgi:ubiquinone/menaquinone biosynthesis C-methylase UbiE
MVDQKGNQKPTRRSFIRTCAAMGSCGGTVTGTGNVDPQGYGGAFGMHIVDVQVDPEMGKVDILRCTAVQDVGKIFIFVSSKVRYRAGPFRYRLGLVWRPWMANEPSATCSSNWMRIASFDSCPSWAEVRVSYYLESPAERIPLSELREKIDQHYAVKCIRDSILRALTGMGKDPNHLKPEDLAPVDQFHIGGREATMELATLAGLRQGCWVLDVGCGLGGSVRYLVDEHNCRATGLDSTREYVEAAKALTEMVGLSAKAEFIQGSGLEIPFPDDSFEVVWTQHAQMNIADKRRFFSEMSRVLKLGGRLVFHEILQGEGGEPHYPLPWANDPSISFLASAEFLRGYLQEAQLAILSWEDKSQRSLDWFAAMTAKLKNSGRPPLGLHLLMGENAKLKSQNQVRNLQEKRIAVIQAVAVKDCGNRSGA